jgi:hypothetical protein
MSALESYHNGFGGTFVQRLGDGTMRMFASSLAAERAAIEIRESLAAHDIQVRIGVHVGEVIVEPERLTGDAVTSPRESSPFAVPGGEHRLIGIARVTPNEMSWGSPAAKPRPAALCAGLAKRGDTRATRIGN